MEKFAWQLSKQTSLLATLNLFYAKHIISPILIVFLDLLYKDGFEGFWDKAVETDVSR